MISRMQGARRALLEAFADLALTHRYADFGVGLIINKARVARSTFYYHFKEKDDLLVENLRPMISAAAQLPFSAAPTPDAYFWVAHLWKHRAKARRLFPTPAARKLDRALTEEIEARLTSVPFDKTMVRLAPLLAHQVAGSISSLLHAWIGGRVSGEPSDIVWLIWSGSRALVGPFAPPTASAASGSTAD